MSNFSTHLTKKPLVYTIHSVTKYSLREVENEKKKMEKRTSNRICQRKTYLYCIQICKCNSYSLRCHKCLPKHNYMIDNRVIVLGRFLFKSF